MSELEATLRKKNQLTLPSEAVEHLGVSEGDTLVIAIREGEAIIRPVKRSYAGLLAGVYGDAERFVERERSNWD